MATDEIHHLFADIRDIAEQQLTLARRIANDSECGEEMLGLLQRRQSIMDRIDVLSAEIPGYSGIVVSNEQADIITIINNIQDYDQQSNKLIATEWKQIGKKLGNVRNNIKAYDAYVPNAVSTEGWFFDRKK